jgi:hypothetical protein
MKGNLMSALVPMDHEAVQQLVTEVKETIATVAENDSQRPSTIKVVDLWKLDSSRKSARQAFSRKRNDIRFI